MTIKNSKKIVKKTGINPMVAAVTGVVIAAGAVVAGALAMNDKKNRDVVNKKIDEVKGELNKNIDKGKKEVKKVVDSALS